MTIQLDHLILMVNDAKASVAFYTRVLGLAHEGQRGPFEVLRVTPDFVLQLAPWGTKGGEHLAFALDPASFDAVFARLRAEGVPYGDSFHDVGNLKGPGVEAGARGDEPSLYFNDPNQHLLEIRRRG
jgi:catechol 2,3-dioxygenase-like lactoylglutathione lyase family enzyme